MGTYTIVVVCDDEKVSGTINRYFEYGAVPRDFKGLPGENVNVVIIDASNNEFPDTVNAVIYDTSIWENTTLKDLKDALQKILQRCNDVEKLNIFPFKLNSSITYEAENTESGAVTESTKLKELLGASTKNKKNIKAIPINISNYAGLKLLLMSLEISAYINMQPNKQASDSQPKLPIQNVAEMVIKIMKRVSPITATHLVNVGNYAEAIAIQMGSDKNEATRIKYLAIMHDVGKLAVPTQILNSIHMLMPEERNVMAKHAELLSQILVNGILNGVYAPEEISALSQHHMRDNNKNELSNLSERLNAILKVADVLSAMTDQRAYNNPKTITSAMVELLKSAKEKHQFNTQCVEATIILLANNLGEIGYDVKQMLRATWVNTDKEKREYIIEIIELLDSNREDIKVNTKAKVGGYTSLGFRLNPYGCLEWRDNTYPVNHEIAVRSELEFLTFIWAKSLKIPVEKITTFSKVRAEIWKKVGTKAFAEEYMKLYDNAVTTVMLQHKLGKTACRAGYKGLKPLPEQVVAAAGSDIAYNRSKLLRQIKILREEIEKNHQKPPSPVLGEVTPVL